MTQVLNGNIHQFVHNSGWNPVIVGSVSAPPSPATRPYMDGLTKVGGDFYERFTAHPGNRDDVVARVPAPEVR
jgi:hypothetical protein